MKDSTDSVAVLNARLQERTAQLELAVRAGRQLCRAQRLEIRELRRELAAVGERGSAGPLSD